MSGPQVTQTRIPKYRLPSFGKNSLTFENTTETPNVITIANNRPGNTQQLPANMVIAWAETVRLVKVPYSSQPWQMVIDPNNSDMTIQNVTPTNIPVIVTVSYVGQKGDALRPNTPNSPNTPGTNVFINEIHYENSGRDMGEGIEIAGTAGVNLNDWSLALYNGKSDSIYKTATLTGKIPDQGNGFGTVSFSISGIQNGTHDGVALVNGSNEVVQFLSYEGVLTAVSGPARGMTAVNIGVSENRSTLVGHSLQLTGSGSVYEDFTWKSAVPETFGHVNTSQTFIT